MQFSRIEKAEARKSSQIAGVNLLCAWVFLFGIFSLSLCCFAFIRIGNFEVIGL